MKRIIMRRLPLLICRHWPITVRLPQISQHQEKIYICCIDIKCVFTHDILCMILYKSGDKHEKLKI